MKVSVFALLLVHTWTFIYSCVCFPASTVYISILISIFPFYMVFLPHFPSFLLPPPFLLSSHLSIYPSTHPVSQPASHSTSLKRKEMLSWATIWLTQKMLSLDLLRCPCCSLGYGSSCFLVQFDKRYPCSISHWQASSSVSMFSWTFDMIFALHMTWRI